MAQAISAFGRQLKQWRRQRGVSQLALAERAQVSQRHISFIETGRARPGEETVHRIALRTPSPMFPMFPMCTSRGREIWWVAALRPSGPRVRRLFSS